MTLNTDMEKMQALHAKQGYLVTATRHWQAIGPVTRNDWEEDDVNAIRWMIIGESTAEEFAQQQRDLGWEVKTDAAYRFFYRMEAMD